MAKVLVDSYIRDVRLLSSARTLKLEQPLRLDLRFKVEGQIRKALHQENWTLAYDKHDTTFLIKYVITIQSGILKRYGVLEPVKFVRKASFYWSRNPKLPPNPPNKKIWVMILMDDLPNLPDTAEDARSLLLDVRRTVELMGYNIGKGRHKLVAHVSASWGRHEYIKSDKIDARSNEVEIICM